MSDPAGRFLGQEAQALLTRLDQVRPFVMNETTVLAAALQPRAQASIEQFLLAGRASLRRRVHNYLRWLRGPGAQAAPAEQQRRFTLIRLGFNDVLSQFDLFSEVITQRSESRTGVWLSGLDTLAADALQVRGAMPQPPPVVTYLARGPGAAIRRARTRLPGGRANPVAIIRMPRERMVGHGIASSLVHEVGHQGAALLGLVESLRPALVEVMHGAPPADKPAWQSFAATISEIVADLFSVSRLGVGSTLGLVSVVSLPRWFVFRPSGTDPHPVPWTRVRLSCAMGHALYPHPQWAQLAGMWASLYPPTAAPAAMQQELARMERVTPAFVQMLLEHRPPSLQGRTIGQALFLPSRRPERLLALWDDWHRAPRAVRSAAPTLAFATVGQARAGGLISPDQEAQLLGDLLTSWAVRSSLDISQLCSTGPPTNGVVHPTQLEITT